MATLSKTQIDRLGDRLRKESSNEADLQLLDEYRQSFRRAYALAVGILREKLGLQPTGRPAKSTPSIIEKLRREKIRLSRMQDIAGCRITVTDIAAQEQTVSLLRDTFRDGKIVDRRLRPSHGYRAVHVIANVEAVSIEIQVRTSMQHLWAELSERLSDVVDLKLKYGGGDPKVSEMLLSMSRHIDELEELERRAINTSDAHLLGAVETMKNSVTTELRNRINQLEARRR